MHKLTLESLKPFSREEPKVTRNQDWKRNHQIKKQKKAIIFTSCKSTTINSVIEGGQKT